MIRLVQDFSRQSHATEVATEAGYHSDMIRFMLGRGLQAVQDWGHRAGQGRGPPVHRYMMAVVQWPWRGKPGGYTLTGAVQ